MKKRAKTFGSAPATLVTAAFGKRSKGKRRSLIPHRRKPNAISQMASRVNRLGGRKKRRRPEITTVLEGVGTVVGAAVAGAQVVSELRRASQREEPERAEEQPASRPEPQSSDDGRTVTEDPETAPEEPETAPAERQES
jgi:hypothetical protein